MAAGNNIGSNNTLSKNTLSKNTLSKITLSNYTIGEIWRTPSPTKPDAHWHCGQGWLVEDEKLRTDGNSRRSELVVEMIVRRGEGDMIGMHSVIPYNGSTWWCAIGDWRMKKINKWAGGVRERSSEGKAATIFIYGGFQKNSPWRCRCATSPPPNLLAPVHRRHSRPFSISSNSVRHPHQCARPSSCLQYQLVHHGRQGPCRLSSEGCSVKPSTRRWSGGHQLECARVQPAKHESPHKRHQTSLVRIDDVELDL